MEPSDLSPSRRSLFWAMLAFSVLVLSLLGWSYLQPRKEQGISLFYWLQEQEVKSLRLELPLDSVRAKVEHDLPARLSWHEAWGGEKALPVEVQLRGNSRKNMCSFPPLKLELDDPVRWKGQVFRASKYKLVTHCFSDDQNESRVMREYLAYRMYNELTDKSLRGHLVQIEYLDSHGQHPPQTHWAILLETKDEMSERLALEHIDKQEKVDHFHADTYHLFAVYQYMIGNTDWNLQRRHNVVLLQNEDGTAFPVPYDFDQAGIVNADYARPHPSLPIQQVTDRYFQWRGHDRQDLEYTLNFLKSKQEQLEQLLPEIAATVEEDSDWICGYLDEFLGNMEVLLRGDTRLVGSSFSSSNPI